MTSAKHMAIMETSFFVPYIPGFSRKDPRMPAARDSNIVKIAVEMDPSHPNYVSIVTTHLFLTNVSLQMPKQMNAQLIEFDQNRPLLLIIADLCTSWNINDPEQYSLQFNDSTNAYITEKNRNEIKNGSVLRLTHSPSRKSQDILEKLQFDSESKYTTFERLIKLSTDYTFALEFINKQGLQYIIDSIEKDEISNSDGFGYALESFVELMNHGIISWLVIT